MKNLKIVSDNDLKDWAKEIFIKNSFKMIDVSKKKETFRRALASGKIYVGDEVFELIKNKEMPKGDPITLAEVSAVLGVKKTSELIPVFPNRQSLKSPLDVILSLLHDLQKSFEYGAIIPNLPSYLGLI